MDEELHARVNALEEMVMAFTALMIRHTYGDDPDGSKLEAFLAVVRNSAETRAMKRSPRSAEQTLAAIDALNARLKASLLLLFSPHRPNA